MAAALPLGSIGFGFVAGALSILSPCVLPLLPLVLGPAAASHRLGVVALTAGLVTSYVAAGLFVATIGFSIGLDGEAIRDVAAALLAGLGVVLLSGALQTRFAVAAGGMSNLGARVMHRLAPSGLGGQFVLGLLLGLIWSPCVGPTLGAASVLAAQGRDLAGVASVMAAFGVGTALPLLLLGRLSRGTLLRAGRTGKRLLGAAAVVVGVMILTGADRVVETALVAASPGWLTGVTTRF